MRRHRPLTWLLPATVLLLALTEAGAQEKAKGPQAAQAALRRLGCEVEEGPAGRPGRKVVFAGCQDLDGALPHLRALTDLRAVDL